MSFLVKSVELSNIRSHDHLIFEPELSGVTSLLGANGTGKSTVVDSIAWTLFGTKIGGAKNKDIMRDGVEYAKDQFYARVMLEVDGQTLLVERKFVSKAGTVEANVYAVLNADEVAELHGEGADDADAEEGNEDAAGDADTDSIDDSTVESAESEADDDTEVIVFGDYVLNHLAGPGVSHAERYIKERLRMDERGFLSSVLIQQKQVDQLISASARERAAVIEDLTGITAVTNALSDARREHNELKKAATYSHADEDGIKEAENNVYAIHQKIVSAEDIAERLEEKLTILKEEGRENSKKFNEAKDNFNALTGLNARLETARQRLADRQVQADELVAERNEKKSALGDMTSADSAKQVIAERDKARTLYDQESADLAGLKSEYKSISEQIDEDAALIDDVLENSAAEDISEDIEEGTKGGTEGGTEGGTDDEAVADPTETLRGLVSRSESSVEALGKDISTAQSEVDSLNAQSASMRNAISVLTADDGHCPTCLQSVDDTNDAVSKLESSIESNNNAVGSLASRLETLREDRDAAQQLLTRYQDAVRVQQRLNERRRSLKSVSDKVEFSSGVLRQLQDSLKGLEKRAESAASIVYQLEEYQKTLKKAQEASKAVNVLTMEIEDLKAEIEGIPAVSQEKLERAQKVLDSKREQYQKLDKERIQARFDERLYREQKRSEENRLRTLREEFAKHIKLMESVSIASGAVKILEEFRKERIDNSVPVIESYASDFLSRFTDGRFVKLNMDNKFNASVVLADGTVRGVGALSGGELSAAAIALRLAVSMLLGGGGERQSIILDEVLVSQDSERSHNIMHTIKDTARGQLIFIAHSDSVNAIADKVFELTVGAEDNSEWAAESADLDSSVDSREADQGAAQSG